MDEEQQHGRWSGAWVDALAFLLGLAMAWQFKWRAGDLVWSLWLSSLVVGYATIVWVVLRMWREHTFGVPGSRALPGVLFMLVFFTIHFGGFHFVHSLLLQNFFPVGGEALAEEGQGFPGWPLYAEVARRYWWFVPLAFIAERKSFTAALQPAGLQSADLPATAPAHRAGMAGKAMSAPYRNVVRMHLLIFFFAAVHFLGTDSFLVYAVVYAAYFFPWRLLRRPEKAGLGDGGRYRA